MGAYDVPIRGGELRRKDLPHWLDGGVECSDVGWLVTRDGEFTAVFAPFVALSVGEAL